MWFLNIWNIRKLFHHDHGTIMALWWRHSPWFLCYQWDFLLDIFTEEGSYQGLKDTTLFGLISDKSAEIRGSEYLKICQFSILNRPFSLFFFLCSYANEAVTSLPVRKICAEWRTSNIFEYLDLIYSALLSDNRAKSWHLVGTDKTYLQ